MITLKNTLENKVLLTLLLALVVSALSIQNLVFYLQPSTSFFVFLAISPFLFRLNKNQKSARYGWLSLTFVVLYFFFKMQLVYFMAFATFLLFLIESNLGKVNALPLFIILLISPYSAFIFDVFGFPARLLITEVAAYLLSFIMDDVVSNGNNILINHNVFSVDPECMGLTMVGYGYATTLLFINSLERKFNKKVKLHKVFGILILATVFIITVNLFRIVVIVILQSPPETVTHELVGLLCFGIYFILPMYFVTKWIIKRTKESHTISSKVKDSKKYLNIFFTITIIGCLAYYNFNRDNYRHIQVDSKSGKVHLAGFDKTTTNHNVIKFINDDALIYIKPSCHFFGPDHSPTICWKGSGYEFINIKLEHKGAYVYYTAELQKEGEILQTAWWFDNGKDKTISQIHWRWKTAIGDEPYRLINVTATSKDELQHQVNQLIDENLFKETSLATLSEL